MNLKPQNSSSHREDVNLRHGLGVGGPVDITVDQKFDVANADLAAALGGANQPNPWVSQLPTVVDIC